MRDLSDRGHVDRVVEPAVAAQRQPVDLLFAGGHLGRGGAVVGGEAVPGGEPGHGDDIADDGGGNDRADAEDLREAGAGRLDRGGQLLLDLAPLGVQVADAGQQFGGELPARLGGRARWPNLAEDPGCTACGDLVRDPAGHQIAEHGVQRQAAWLRARDRSRCLFAQTLSTMAWSSAITSRRVVDRSAATATDRASWGSLLPVFSVC